MADEKASDLKGCSEEVPLLGVTREFDFGQFIELFDDSPDPSAPQDTPVISRIVIQLNSTLASARNASTGDPPVAASSSAASTAAPGGVPVAYILNGPVGGPYQPGQQEVHLFDLTENGPGAKKVPLDVEVSDANNLFKKGTIKLDGRDYKVELEDADKDDLRMGLAVTIFASASDEQMGKVPVRLSLPFEPVKLTEHAMANVLTGDSLDSSVGEVRPALTADAIRALLSGAPVFTHGLSAEGKKTPLKLQPPSSQAEPLSDRFEVFDLASFIANPVILSKGGGRVPLNLTPENVQQLVAGGATRLQLAGRPLDFTVVTDNKQPMNGDADALNALEIAGLPLLKTPTMTWREVVSLSQKAITKPHYVHPHKRPPLGGHKTPHKPADEEVTDTNTNGTETALSMTDKVQPRLPTGTGLPVAVFVPWKQTWTLKGFSRGNLLNTIAMAPLEQLTMQVNSWERKSRSLEQSSETDVDQQTDVSQTTRDTEDVFKEMISKHDFAWQIAGSIDASYSPGVASIKVSAGGGVSETNNIVQTARRSTQSVKESTVKASSRVRSRRVTRITQTVESGKEERVTRIIKNPNQGHTLTLDFFETLAHYEIKLEFIKDRLRLVVLLPNPISVTDFESEVIRRNETALRNALIDEALVDGFEACRFVGAYEEAKDLVVKQKAEAAKADEVDSQRDTAAPMGAPDPAAPQQAEVERVVKEMISALQSIKTGEIDTALTALGKKEPISESARRKGQQWLFINFCAAKLPSVLSTLDSLSNGSTTPIAAAPKIMAVLPKPDAPVNLSNLNQMSPAEKETCCIVSKLNEAQNGVPRYKQHDWDWPWWTSRMGEEGLYTANDAGLAGLADQLQKAYTAWEAKKAQGAAMKDQDVAQTEAEGKQEQASADDKLSMAFPLEDLARAYERMKTLMSHLNLHKPFYNYALFQALPPSEQSLQIVQASNGRLQVGLFEPRVVAMSGTRLVVPLTPLASTAQLQTFVTELGNDLAAAFQGAANTPDTTILPTPGISISSRLGKCSCTESYIDTAREHELTRLECLARQEQAEADRREARLAKKDLDDFRQPPPAVRLELEKV